MIEISVQDILKTGVVKMVSEDDPEVKAFIERSAKFIGEQLEKDFEKFMEEYEKKRT